MSTHVATPLPDVDLTAGAQITVELDDPAAVVEKLNVYALNLETGQIEEVPAVQPLLAYVPQEDTG